MKQLVQSYRGGRLRVEEVPPPALRPGGVLVEVVASVISPGTELASLALARSSLLGKARARPELVGRLVGRARRDGVVAAVRQARRRLEEPLVLGYSAAGKVAAIGEGVSGLRVGDRVACAGGGYAAHAEVIFVPRRLCVPVPEGLSLRDAAFTTLGAIAMHAVRLAGAGLGEEVAVVGLGLIGLLAVEVLVAAGCRVVGVDPDDGRAELARKLGAELAVAPGDGRRAVIEWTDGRGADAVIVAAATRSAGPLALAGEVARDRGRVVVVGNVGTTFPRSSYYEKELELRVARSYGPGRYDRSYEEAGHDYPLGYVRWTEERNLESFLRLLAAGRVQVGPLVGLEVPIERAPEAYRALEESAPGERPVAVVLRYAAGARVGERAAQRRIVCASPSRPSAGRRAAPLAVGVIGAGSFARSTLLPLLRRRRDVRLRGLATATGASGLLSGRAHGFEYITTDPEEILADDTVGCVFILTRNQLHAPLAAAALRAGKAVFVEKPLATSLAELGSVVAAAGEWEAVAAERRLAVREPPVMVGFNRRFAPLTCALRAFLAGRREPAVACYRVNAGVLPRDHWIYDAAEGGSRLVAEACHFVDFLQAILGTQPVRVSASGVARSARMLPEENLVLGIDFADGSVATIVYAAGGDPVTGKERLELFAGGRTAVLEDFRSLTLAAGGRLKRQRSWWGQNKGYRAEIDAFLAAVLAGAPSPVPLADAVTCTLATFAAARSLRTGEPALLPQELPGEGDLGTAAPPSRDLGAGGRHGGGGEGGREATETGPDNPLL